MRQLTRGIPSIPVLLRLRIAVLEVRDVWSVWNWALSLLGVSVCLNLKSVRCKILQCIKIYENYFHSIYLRVQHGFEQKCNNYNT